MAQHLDRRSAVDRRQRAGSATLGYRFQARKVHFPFSGRTGELRDRVQSARRPAALGTTYGSVRIHETADPTQEFTLRPQTRCDASGENPSVQVFSVAFNPGKDKGDEMVSTTLDGCLRLWNVKEQRLIENHSLNNTGFFPQASIPAAKGLPSPPTMARFESGNLAIPTNLS